MKQLSEETKIIIISAISDAYAAGERAAISGILHSLNEEQRHEKAVNECMQIFYDKKLNEL